MTEAEEREQFSLVVGCCIVLAFKKRKKRGGKKRLSGFNFSEDLGSNAKKSDQPSSKKVPSTC